MSFRCCSACAPSVPISWSPTAIACASTCRTDRTGTSTPYDAYRRTRRWPATSPPTSSPQDAQAACRAQRTAIGDAAFKQLHGTNANKSNAFGMCVSKALKSAQANNAAAVDTCKKEQSDSAFATAHSGKTFDQFYG